MSADDFKHIRWSLLLALVMVLAGAAAVIVMRHMLQVEQEAHQQALARRVEMQNQLMRARDEEQDIRQKIARFNDLSGRQLIGDEQRLDWLEAIRRIKATRRLYDIQYEIAPQQPLDAAIAPGASGGYDFLASTMRLQMQLLHEGDLLHFLDDLRRDVHAYLRPRSCVIERLAKIGSDVAPTVAGNAPQLRADCVIDWITIRERTPAPQTAG